MTPSKDGWQRDASGRIVMTGIERQLLEQLVNAKNNGHLKEAIHPQFPVKHGQKTYTIDFAMPRIKLGVEVDGGLFHSTDEQIAKRQTKRF
jgi:very-short-patch-repair endonuclease